MAFLVALGVIAFFMSPVRREKVPGVPSPTVHVARANILSSVGECQEAGDSMQRALDVLKTAFAIMR